MDGHFVDNISFGIPVCNALKDYPIFKDVHLMISDPFKYIDNFIENKYSYNVKYSKKNKKIIGNGKN